MIKLNMLDSVFNNDNNIKSIPDGCTKAEINWTPGYKDDGVLW